ncbi:MAG: SUMF1/EgtB/PvdO family nonheme iron enzyme [Planctomycetes bacterium]|nr:SUMF1/EgtB/PvdO family nonheme iron enzyme [Planctomycetota bacterium]
MPSARQELLAIALWRQVIADRSAGRIRSAADYAALFPAAAEVVAEVLADPEATAADGAPRTVGHYRLIEPLGRGGQGEVWLAADIDLQGREVALKVIPLTGHLAPGAAMRLRREIELALRAEVPGVCTVYDTGHDGDCAWIAMRRVEGATLAERLQRAPGPPGTDAIAERLGWLGQAAETAHALHERGIVHRDLKPGNLMIERTGSCVVLDFGVAKALEDEGQLTRTGQPAGTPAYMAPEQLEGGVAATRAIDVWSLGVMLYECCTGSRPFDAATPHALERQIDAATPVPARRRNPNVSRDLEVVIATALAREPAHRYATATALAHDVARVLDRRPVLARPLGPLTHAWRHIRRRPAISALTAAALLIVAGSLAISLVLRQRAEREVARAEQATRLLEHVSVRYRLSQLQRELEDELAIDSSQVDQFANWYARAEAVSGRLGNHQAFLAELRLQATAAPGDDPATRRRQRNAEHTLLQAQSARSKYRGELAAAEAAGDAAKAADLAHAVSVAEEIVARAEAARTTPVYRFADPETQAMHDLVEQLVHDLEVFGQMRPGLPTLLACRLLQRKAATVRRDSIDLYAEAWAAAIDRTAARDGPYAGLRIPPQEGLVPLGPDPQSGLEEFAQLYTGDVPARDPATGTLQYGADPAIVLVLLPGGAVEVGALAPTANEREPRFLAPPPRSRVELDPFFLGKHEVTQAQWRAIMWTDPSVYGGEAMNRHPVTQTTAQGAERFTRRLGLRLPSEAQWEYACRAGSTTDFSFGADPAAMRDHGNIWEDRARRKDEPPDGWARSAAVGSFLPNGFGLHDLHGNLREWTCDTFGSYDLPPIDGTGRRAPSGKVAVAVRGGSFLLGAAEAQSWWREFVTPDHHVDVGIRVARVVTLPE